MKSGGAEESEDVWREVDRVMREVGGFKMGPFELMDLIGLDINLQVTESIWNNFQQHPRFAPHPLQQRLVQTNRLGKKTGKGFYTYAKSNSPLGS